ncbi:hypothetical protein MK489_16060 [Myxococcota bacterium]|nr:hypothetical protein [Myxococcota bacterium]
MNQGEARDVSIWKQLKNGWMAIVARFGHAQTLVILANFYVFLIGPTAIATRLGRADYLSKRGLGKGGTAWRDSDAQPATLERAKLTT